MNRDRHWGMALLIFAMVLCVTGVPAQHVHYWILEDGDAAPGSPGDTLDDLNTPSISPNGDYVVYQAVTDSNLDCLYRNGQLLAREGLPIGPGGPLVTDVLRNQSFRSVRDNGDVLWECNTSIGVEALVLNDTILHRAGDPLAAVPGLFHLLVSSSNLLNDGRILYGSVASDGHSRIIFDNNVMQLNSQSPIVTGVPIVGGALDGLQWKFNEQFVRVRVNSSGDILFRGTLSGAGVSNFNDRVWVLKRAASPEYELLFRENVDSFPTNPTLQGNLAPPVGFVTQGNALTISDNGDWAIHVHFDIPSVNFLHINEGIIVGMAAINGGAPTLLYQRGQMIYPQNAPAGWLGDITHVHMNGNGDLMITGIFHGRPALFLWQSGVVTQLYDYPDPINGDDRFAALFSSVLADDGRIASEGVRQLFFNIVGDGIYRTEVPTLQPVRDQSCQPLSGSRIRADWTLPTAASYSSIEISIDGALQATLPGTADSYTSTPLPANGSVRLSIVGIAGADRSPPRHCDAVLALCDGPTDLTCLHEGVCGDDSGVTLTWTNAAAYTALSFEREDVLLGQAVVIPVNPALETFVDTTAIPGTLYEYRQFFRCSGSNADIEAGSCGAIYFPGIVPPVTGIACGSSDYCNNLVTISWTTQGLPYDAVTLYRDGVFLADVTQLTSYTDTVVPNLLLPTPVQYELVSECGGAVGTISCSILPFFEGPTDIECTGNGCDSTVELSWTNNAQYSSLTLVRNGTPVSPQPSPGDTTYVDGPLPDGTYDYELTGGCGLFSEFVTCTASVVALPPTECGSFLRGDCNNWSEMTGTVNLADAIFMLSVLFPPQGCVPDTDGVHDAAPECPFADCMDACDANNDETFNLADVVFLLGTLFPPGGCVIDTDGIPDPGECPFLQLPNALSGCDLDTDTAGSPNPPTDALDCEGYVCP
ncbi:MAG: hypothetical protein AAF581_05975 [Planctomycetota bacterium]